MAMWGVVSSCMGAVHSYNGLLLARFFIGFVEAVFFPGALYYLSLFYNRKQYALRAAILYSGSQLGNAFGGLFAIGILTLDGAHGIAGWRWLFIVEGVMTVGIALVFACILPNSPRTVRGMTEIERDWQQWNYEQDQGQQDDGKEIGPGKGFLLALTDPKMWLMLVVLYAIYISAAVTNFFPSVVETLGYSRNTTYALTAPPFCLCVIVMMINGWHSDKTGNRYWHIVGPLFVSVVANIIAVSSLNTAARYVAMMLMPGSVYMASTVLLSWVAGSLNQPAIKRACAIAFINAICNTPNIWTSYVYFGAPRYLVAFLVNMAASGVAILVATITRFYLRRQNIKLDRGADVGKSGPTAAQQIAGFRYML
jgi:MFS family permease